MMGKPIVIQCKKAKVKLLTKIKRRMKQLFCPHTEYKTRLVPLNKDYILCTCNNCGRTWVDD